MIQHLENQGLHLAQEKQTYRGERKNAVPRNESDVFSDRENEFISNHVTVNLGYCNMI